MHSAAHTQQLGADTKFEVSSFCYLGLWLGRDFLRDPLHEWAQNGLNAPRPRARTLYWKEEIFLYFNNVLGENGAILVRAAARALDHMDRCLNVYVQLSPTGCVAAMQEVYPEKISFCGTAAARNSADFIMAEPRLPQHPNKFFAGFCCLFSELDSCMIRYHPFVAQIFHQTREATFMYKPSGF